MTGDVMAGGHRAGAAGAGAESGLPQLSHWGRYRVRCGADGQLLVTPDRRDPCPPDILRNIASVRDARARVTTPAVRRGWLQDRLGARHRRGEDDYLPVSWDTALDLVAEALSGTLAAHGPSAVFGGSYGWSSAGRFHHAQSQVHRFLNCQGGYVRSVNTYSHAASEVLLPHVVGGFDDFVYGNTSWPEIAENTGLLLCLGGLPPKNRKVSPGGVLRHTVRGHLETLRDRGAEIVLVSPDRRDLDDDLATRWLPILPGTDTAFMLAVAYAVDASGHIAWDFIEDHVEGAGEFLAYVRGESDGVPKSPRWASGICRIPERHISELADRLCTRRSLINTSFSLQRAEFGEQALWCSIALAALIGQIGLPGGGVTHGLGAFNAVGQSPAGAQFPRLPQGKNPVTDFIPVAKFAEMLLRPGETFAYNGGSYTYPDIRLVYWAGGNPFHHHQDLNVLREALRWPETVIVNESSWTATAKHADIVLPATTTLERNDIGTAQGETEAVAMKRVIDPVGEALDDYTIFTRLSRRLHCETAFTERRTADEWIRHLYSQWAARREGLPDFDEFWSRGCAALPAGPPPAEPSLRRFRAAPRTHPLPTPSGKIEIYSRAIASFGYADCPGHPAWIEPAQWGGARLARLYPLSLLANQPAGRLHSQLDYGAASEERKVAGLEPLRMNPRDASARGLADGERVLVISARGRCLAGLVVDPALMRGVVQLSTGAWFSGTERTGAEMLALGNPNVLTAGATTSRLAQGCAGHMTLVDVVREPTH